MLRYRQALRLGFDQVRQTGLITANHVIEIQAELEPNNAGFRKECGNRTMSAARWTCCVCGT